MNSLNNLNYGILVARSRAGVGASTGPGPKAYKARALRSGDTGPRVSGFGVGCLTTSFLQ